MKGIKTNLKCIEGAYFSENTVQTQSLKRSLLQIQDSDYLKVSYVVVLNS